MAGPAAGKIAATMAANGKIEVEYTIGRKRYAAVVTQFNHKVVDGAAVLYDLLTRPGDDATISYEIVGSNCTIKINFRTRFVRPFVVELSETIAVSELRAEIEELAARLARLQNIATCMYLGCKNNGVYEDGPYYPLHKQ